MKTIFLVRRFIISFEMFFSKFYRRHHELVSKFNVEIKSLLHQDLSKPEFYGDVSPYGQIVFS